MLSYGRRLSRAASLGVTVKIVHQALDNRSDFAVGLDAGVTARIYRHLHLGLVAHDLARPELKLEQMKERLPTSVGGGLALRDLSLSPFARATATIEVEKSDDRDALLHTGAELTLHETLALRLGYDRDNLTIGTGLKINRMHFDYAYKLVDWVADIHQVSVSLGVGMSVAEKKRRQELALLPPEPTEEELRLQELLATANRFFHRFQLDSARTYFQMALDYAPGSEEIMGTLAAIEEARIIQEQQEEALRAARKDVSQTLTNFVAQAQQMLDHKIYQAALDLLELIFDTDPTNEAANLLRNDIIFARAAEIATSLEKAQRAVDSSRWFDAVELYNRVLDLDPNNTQARDSKQRVLATMDLSERVRLGIELYDRGDYDEARARFEAILEVNPNEAVALEYLRRIGEVGKAAKEKPAPTLEELQRDQVNWELYLEGLRHMRNKEYRLAIEAWEKVLETYPNNQNTLNNIEQARLRLGTQEAEH
jgi:tetratricopeptide (TPR) repeat protein